MSLVETMKLGIGIALGFAVLPLVVVVVGCPLALVGYVLLDGVIRILNGIEQGWLRLERLLSRAKTR